MSAFQLLQGANTLGLKKEEKPLSWYVWAPTWAEIREVTVGNYGLRSSIALGPTCVQVMVGGGGACGPCEVIKRATVGCREEGEATKMVESGQLRFADGAKGRGKCGERGMSDDGAFGRSSWLDGGSLY